MPAQAEHLPGGWVRITTDCDTVGLHAPPALVKGQVSKAAGGWLLTVQASGMQEDVTRWLRTVGAVEVAEGRGQAPELKARFGSLPDSIDILARVARVDQLEVSPDGALAMTVRPPRGALESLLVTLDARPYDRDAELSPRQEELLRECVASGYYSIPRTITLRDLARRLGMSTTALSLTLRRAEARIVASYMGRKQPLGARQADEGEILDRSAAANVVAQDLGPAQEKGLEMEAGEARSSARPTRAPNRGARRSSGTPARR